MRVLNSEYVIKSEYIIRKSVLISEYIGTIVYSKVSTDKMMVYSKVST